MKCTICGKINPSDARFCSDCAAPLNAGQEEQMQVQTPEVDWPSTSEPSSSQMQQSNAMPSYGNPADAENLQNQSEGYTNYGDQNQNQGQNFGHQNQNQGQNFGHQNQSQGYQNSGYPPYPQDQTFDRNSGVNPQSQGYGAFIPRVRQRTAQEHVRNVAATLAVIIAMVAVVYFVMQFFQGVGDKVFQSYVVAYNEGNVDKMLELSIPDDFYAYTEREYGVDKNEYRDMMVEYFKQNDSVYKIEKIEKMLADRNVLVEARKVYEEDWGTERNALQEIEVYEVTLSTSVPGYEPLTKPYEVYIVKYEGKWYVYTWILPEQVNLRKQMEEMKGTSNQ